MARWRGIDVSEFQGYIDFDKVKAAGIDCIIIRYGDGLYQDIYFERNMKEAQKRGFHFGAYLLSRAVNKAQGKEEGQRLIKACKRYNFDMPLYIDMEAAEISRFADSVIDGFLEACQEAGVTGGVYANLNWFNNYISTKRLKNYPLWIAQYNDRITHYMPEWFGIWQYTSKGSCPGISENVDLNHVYVDYWNEKESKAYTDQDKIKAVDVLFGKYGAGDERVKKLGKDYEAVQSLVNEIIERIT